MKATAAGDAPALDIWLMKQLAMLGGGALSQALWAAARKVAGMCQTEDGPIRPPEAGVALGGAAGFWAKAHVARSREANQTMDCIFFGILDRNSVMQRASGERSVRARRLRRLIRCLPERPLVCES